jgi:hypothetical protein
VLVRYVVDQSLIGIGLMLFLRIGWGLDLEEEAHRGETPIQSHPSQGTAAIFVTLHCWHWPWLAEILCTRLLHGTSISLHFWDKVSLCSPSWPQTLNLPASASIMLGLQARTTMSSYTNPFPLFPYCILWKEVIVPPVLQNPLPWGHYQLQKLFVILWHGDLSVLN